MKVYGRKWFVRWVAAFVSIVLFGTYLGSLSMNTLTVSAICCRKDGFDKSRYTLTGNVAQDVATIAKSQAGRTCSDFGYSGVDYGAWCDEYVADCLENAGCDDSIVAHGGTVADFEKKMRKRGAVVVSSPQPGDLLFFSWSHVEIVTRVEGGTVYCAGGNNQGKTYPGGRCAGERNAQSVANSMGGSIRLYLRPNYPNLNPPTWATLSVENNQTVFYSGDTVNFSMASDYATNYTMGVDVNGVRALTQECNGNTSSNIMNDVGEYAVYVTAWNSAGYVDSNVVYFKVIERPWYSSLTPVDLGEQFDSVILAKEPWITFCAFGEDKDYNVELKKEEGITAEMWRFNRQSDGSYVITNFATGRVLDAYGLGTTDFTNVFTDEYNGGDNQKWFIYGKDGGGFVIRAAYTSMVLDIDHAIFESGTNIEMHTKNDSSAQTIALYYENATYGSPKIGDIVSTSTNNSITLNLSDSYYVDKRKVYRSTDKKYWELVNESTDGKGTEITDNNLKPATTYYYKIECSNRYYTETSSIIAVKTNAISLGDLNSDNTLTTADAVLLQRYLLQERTLTQSQWQTADLNADGTVNGFDLALLRQKLVA